MPASEVTYTGLVGSQQDFSVPFGYLSQDHVKAKVNGVASTLMFLTDNVVRITPAPVGELRIYRETPSTPIKDFSNTGTFDADELDEALLQSLYIDEETRDYVSEQVDTLVAEANQNLEDAQDLLEEAQDLVSHITISTSNPTGGAEGDLWFKVSI